MKAAYLTFLLSFSLIYSAQSEELPINPWESSNHTVRTEPQTYNTTNSSKTSQSQQDLIAQRVKEIDENNARIRKANEERRKAEIEYQRKLLEQSKTANSGNDNGWLDSISSSFTKKTPPKEVKQEKTSASFTNGNNDLLKDYEKEYDKWMRDSKRSINKLKRQFNDLTNFDFEKSIDDTLKSLQ